MVHRQIEIVRRNAAIFCDLRDPARAGQAINIDGWNGHTIVNKISPAGLAGRGSVFKLTLRAAGNGPFEIADCFIGLAALSGNAWGFNGSQVRVKFGGANSVAISAGAERVSDGTLLVFDGTKTLVIAMNVQSDNVSHALNLDVTKYVAYRKGGVQNADDAGAGPGAVSGYEALGGRILALSKIEIG